MSTSIDLSQKYTIRTHARSRHTMRSTWAQWATKQAKAAQQLGDRDSAALFLALAQGLADATVRELRAG